MVHEPIIVHEPVAKEGIDMIQQESRQNTRTPFNTIATGMATITGNARDHGFRSQIPLIKAPRESRAVIDRDPLRASVTSSDRPGRWMMLGGRHGVPVPSATQQCKARTTVAMARNVLLQH